MIVYLSLEDVLKVHQEVITATGGTLGIRDIAILDSAVHRPQATFGGIDLYSELADKAAALLHSIIVNHPFIDGNKRTGFVAMDIFLRINGLHLVASEDEKYDFVLKVVEEKVAFHDIVSWIKRNTEELK